MSTKTFISFLANSNILVILVALAMVVQHTTAWTIDPIKYPNPPARDTQWNILRDEFDNCQFGYGLSYRGVFEDYRKANGNSFKFDYVTVWVGDKVADWSDWWEQKALELALEYNKPLAIFSYVIANAAKKNLNISDCDVETEDPSQNLCHYGSTYMRQHWEDNIIPQYKLYSQKINDGIAAWRAAGKIYTRSVFWFVEPDFQQYRATSDTQQLDGGIPDDELAGKYFIEMVSTIKKNQLATPNRIFTDISPWLNDEFEGWMELYPVNQVDGFYGGLNALNDRVKVHSYNDVTYNDVNSLYGGNKRPIFAQGGWGVDGADSDTYLQWLQKTNVNERRKSYIFAASFSNDDPLVVVNAVESALTHDGTCYYGKMTPAEIAAGVGNTDTNNGTGGSTSDEEPSFAAAQFTIFPLIMAAALMLV